MPPTTQQGGEILTPTAFQAGTFARPQKGVVINAIRQELMAEGMDWSLDISQGFLAMLEWAHRLCRQQKHFFFPLSAEEMKLYHDILEVIMKPGVDTPPAGSAHELIHQFLLGRNESGNEQDDKEWALVHTVDPTYEGEVKPCAVELRLVRR